MEHREEQGAARLLPVPLLPPSLRWAMGPSVYKSRTVLLDCCPSMDEWVSKTRERVILHCLIYVYTRGPTHKIQAREGLHSHSCLDPSLTAAGGCSPGFIPEGRLI